MDDETYIKADTKQIPGQEFFVGKTRLGVPKKFRKKKVDKFAKKYLVWQAICVCGKINEPYITTGNMNANCEKQAPKNREGLQEWQGFEERVEESV